MVSPHSFILIFHPSIPINFVMKWTTHEFSFLIRLLLLYITLWILIKNFVESSKRMSFDLELANVLAFVWEGETLFFLSYVALTYTYIQKKKTLLLSSITLPLMLWRVDHLHCIMMQWTQLYHIITSYNKKGWTQSANGTDWIHQMKPGKMKGTV